MTDKQIEKLENRNEAIINEIIEKMNSDCPGAIDLIGIAGSFCSGDIYEKSDLDLVIIVNDEKAKVLDKCFIMDDIGFDIYTKGWSRLEKMAEYNDPYVTKLIDLDIIYTKDKKVSDKYKALQKELKKNMKDKEVIYKKVGVHYGEALRAFKNIMEASSMSLVYRELAKLIVRVEYIVYMLSNNYVKYGVKRVPDEVCEAGVLSEGILNLYLQLPYCVELDDIIEKSTLLLTVLKEILADKNIETIIEDSDEEVLEKKQITADDLTGTYEEIYSNWKNKMYHAIQMDSSYLSFMTMASCQEFYDEMAKVYDIPFIELISKYNPQDLEANAKYFDEAMEEWKKLYDMFDKNIVVIDSPKDIYKGVKENVNKIS